MTCINFRSWILDQKFNGKEECDTHVVLSSVKKCFGENFGRHTVWGWERDRRPRHVSFPIGVKELSIKLKEHFSGFSSLHTISGNLIGDRERSKRNNDTKKRIESYNHDQMKFFLTNQKSLMFCNFPSIQAIFVFARSPTKCLTFWEKSFEQEAENINIFMGLSETKNQWRCCNKPKRV